MSFILYDLIFLIVFCLFLIIFLVLRKDNIKREGLLILYRTELGIKIIDYISQKYKKILDKLEYVIIAFGYIFMTVMLYFLFQLFYYFIKYPSVINIVKIPPIMPLIPYLPNIFKADYLPPFYFTYWIIVLAIAAISHEFLHGIFFKREGIQIKSTGFAFLGPFLAFFVEPDEKKMKKMKIKKQLVAISAGSFANLIMTILFFFILILFFNLVFVKSGVIFSTYAYGMINGSEINKIGDNLFVNYNSGLNLTQVFIGDQSYYIQSNRAGEKGLLFAYDDAPALKAGLQGAITEFDEYPIKESKDLKFILAKSKPGDNVVIKTILTNGSTKEFSLELVSKPGNKSQAYLGIASYSSTKETIIGKIKRKIAFFKDPDTYYKPKVAEDLMIFLYNLIWWIVIINLSVALGNMLPLGIFDGGRFFYLTILGLTKSESIAKKAFKFSTTILLAVFLLLLVVWFANYKF